MNFDKREDTQGQVYYPCLLYTSISGGGDKISYYISLGMQDQKGMYKIRTDELKRYNTMLSVNAKVND